MPHFRNFGFALALTLVATFAAAAKTAPPLPAFRARYQLLRNGTPIGEATLTLRKSSDGAWTFTTVSKGTSGLAGLLGAATRETSVFHWVGDLPQCDSYDYTLNTAVKQQHRSVRCDWSHHVIEVDDRGKHTFEARPGTLERHTVPLALAAGLSDGKKQFDLAVAVRDRIEDQHYAARGKATVQVPAGSFDAIRVGRTDDGDNFEAWFAPHKLPVPVKIDQRGKGGFSLELESWSAR